MYRSVIVSALFAVSVAAQQPAGNMPPMHPSSMISTSATGEARYPPDRATISAHFSIWSRLSTLHGPAIMATRSPPISTAGRPLPPTFTTVPLGRNVRLASL